MPAPMARPATNTATIMLNAYVVGPRMRASSRVHTTCSVSDANPEIPRAAAARPGRATFTCGGGPAARDERPFAVRFAGWALGPACSLLVPPARALAATSVPAAGPSPAIRHAPAAAAAFKRTPTQVVPLNPNAGRSTNPAASAPIAAPVVFAAYITPASRAAARALWMNQRDAVGKVAPIAAAGIASSSRLAATR